MLLSLLMLLLLQPTQPPMLNEFRSCANLVRDFKDFVGIEQLIPALVIYVDLKIFI